MSSSSVVHDGESAPMLLARVGSCLCGLPIAQVTEVMRPLPIEALADMPPFVLGLSIVRGSPVPVIHTARLVGAIGREQAAPTRFISVRLDQRRVVLAVDSIAAIRTLPRETTDALSPMLGSVNADIIDAVGALDAQLLLLLRSARIVPDRIWAAIETGTRQ